MNWTPVLSSLNSAESRSGMEGQSGRDGIECAILVTRQLATCDGKLGWKHGKPDTWWRLAKMNGRKRLPTG